MRPNTLFWGIVLILVGGLLVLSNLGILGVDMWNVLWPALVILLGVWMLLGVFMRRSPAMEHASVPLEGARRARLRLNHGAGRLQVQAGAGPGNLAEGEFGGGLELRKRLDGDTLEATLSVPSQVWFPFGWGPGRTLDWSVRLGRDVPMRLELDTGANEAHVDLSELLVEDLRLNSGASSTTLTLPANAGQTHAKISVGAASVRVNIPQGVAARIHTTSGVASITVDRERFPRSAGVYQSPDYETAANKVDLNIEAGVGSIDVR
ncbi:MAG: DUF5668 domain-containing protein [Chloroflexota bacterium]